MTVLTKTEFIEKVESLPPLPAIAHRILSVTESGGSSAPDVAKVLSEDPAIAAKILRVANSPYFGASRPITQISRAVVMLGTIGVRNMVLGICARDALPPPAPEPVEHATLWRHAIAAASAAELIARQVGFKPPEEAFLAGLLHNIGQLAMVIFQPDSYRAVLRDPGRGVRLLALEQAELGIDHTEAGSKILARWGLPETLCHVVRRHHSQEVEEDDPSARLLAVVMLADTLAQMMGFGFDVPCAFSRRAQISANRLGLTECDQLQILDRLEHRVKEAASMFTGGDEAKSDPEEPASQGAVWVSPETPHGSRIGRLLLQQHGYEVRPVLPSEVDEDLSPDDLVVLALPEEDVADKMALALARQDHRRIVLLSDPDEDAPLRRRDPETGICRIPVAFTTFDLVWVEEQLQP